MTASAMRKDELLHAEQRRVRACLKCESTFESLWFGERICRRCKGGSTWRSGSAVDLPGARSRTGQVRR